MRYFFFAFFSFIVAFLLNGCSTLPKAAVPRSLTAPPKETVFKKEATPFIASNMALNFNEKKVVIPKAKITSSFYKVGKPYSIKGQIYHPKEEKNYKEIGQASWYGSAFDGHLTANGEIYNMHHLSAAHRTMPLPSYARVTNLANGLSIIVRVNDRGPYSKKRIIDLSSRAAELLRYKKKGIARVRVEYVGPAPLHTDDQRYLEHSFQK